ncbi:MAG: hypothetical protein RLZZ179_1426 [Verrucomicrobiota bacterium]
MNMIVTVVMIMVMPVIMVMMIVVMFMFMFMFMVVTVIRSQVGIFEGKSDPMRGVANGAVPERLLFREGFPVGHAMTDENRFQCVRPMIEIGITAVRIAGGLGPQNRLAHDGFPFLAGDDALFDQEVTDRESLCLPKVAEGRCTIVPKQRRRWFLQKVFAELDRSHRVILSVRDGDGKIRAAGPPGPHRD